MNVERFINRIYDRWRRWTETRYRLRQIRAYLQQGRRPWSKGYYQYRDDFLQHILSDASLLEKFRENRSFPEQYGRFLDERVVEYPWLMTRISDISGKLLDAGSSLNFSYLLRHPRLHQKEKTIFSLQPEKNCYWKDRISYIFGDLRHMPFLDNWFDEVVSISTIEHVGMNNTLYTDNSSFHEHNQESYLQAIIELKRVTKSGGKVYITVPYGKYTDFGWYQQFDAAMITTMIQTFEPQQYRETYYCYENDGWNVSNKEYCAQFEGFNIHDTKYFNPNSIKDYDTDYAACSRAIAALEFWK